MLARNQNQMRVHLESDMLYIYIYIIYANGVYYSDSGKTILGGMTYSYLNKSIFCEKILEYTLKWELKCQVNYDFTQYVEY